MAKPAKIERIEELDERPQAARQYAQVQRGAKGESAAQLKKLLAANGYTGLSSTDKFGGKAEAALRQFQRSQGMAATGVADDATWEALMQKFQGVTPLGNPYDSYQGPDAAQADLASLEGGGPGEYQSGYQRQIDQLLQSVLDREPFSYNMNADPLYQQYRDQYIAGGQRAMQDAMGQAAALTGGYASSYAATAGSQAYQQYLTGLNGKALDLYDRAYAAYQDQGSALQTGLDTLRALDDSAYARSRDQAAGWRADRDYYYQKTQDDQAQDNWQDEYDYATRKWKRK